MIELLVAFNADAVIFTAVVAAPLYVSARSAACEPDVNVTDGPGVGPPK